MTPEEKKLKDKNRAKVWYENNKEKAKQTRKEYYVNNKNIIKVKSEQNKNVIKINQKIWRDKNKDYIKENRILNKTKRNEYEKLTRSINPLYKLKGNIRTAIYMSLKRNGYPKTSKTQNILDCSFEEFKQHLENHFEAWMTWDNYALYNGELNYGWDIDHIIPIATHTDEIDLIRLNHYTNLQPLCSKINRDIKKANIQL